MAASSKSAEEIRERVAAAVEAMGVEAVDVVYRRMGRRWLLRVDIDRAGPKGVDVADCQRVSRALEDELEQSEIVPHSYVLEVSSPGLDRPIVSDDDLRRNRGRRVEWSTADEEGKERRLRGTLVGYDDDSVLVEIDGNGEHRLARGAVHKMHQAIEFNAGR